MKKGKLFILSAPSGTGKTTILKYVMEQIEGLAFSISHTTRKPRKGETDGVEYHFVERQTFIEMINEGEFLEHAEVHDNFYGTSRFAVEDLVEKGVDVILDIDVQGASIIRNSGTLDATYIFIAPPDVEELENRLRGRGLDDNETITTRLSNAAAELQCMHLFDYLIVNDDLDDAVKMFEAVVLAERARSRRDSKGKHLAIVSQV